MSDRKYRQRGYQDDDRDRPADAADRRVRRPSRARPPAHGASRRTARKNINMPGYREVVRCAQCGNVGRRTRSARQPLPALRHRPARLRAVRVVRSGQPLRVHAADPGARLAEERAEHLHAVRAAHDRRARNDDAAHRRRAEGVRRSVQVLGPWHHGAALRTGPADRPQPPGGHHAPGHAALLHPDDRRSRNGAASPGRSSTRSSA